MAASDEIKEELDHILTQVAAKLNIANYEKNQNSEASYGDGFVAHFYTGDIRNKDTGDTIDVAIKKAPISDIGFHEIFENEDKFYKTMLPALNDLQKEIGVTKPFDNVPTYYCGGLDTKKEFIAMENLKPLGYVMFDKTQYFDEEHLKQIFKIYGKLHSLSYVLRISNNEKYQNLFKGLNDFMSKMETFVVEPMKAAVSAAINSLDAEKDKLLLDELEDLLPNLLKMFKKANYYNGEHKCLIHGDCWSNNMLFKYSESRKLLDIKLIDFQLCQENSPIHDLSYFFYSGAAKKDFDMLDNYLKIYYESFSGFAKELGADLSEIFSFDVLKNEWKENALYGAILGIYLWQVKLIPKRDFVEIIGNVEKPSMEETIKLFKVLLDSVHKTDGYKERTTAILRHAFEYGIINKTKIEENKE